MKNYLYEDLYTLEDKHWWHKSKRRIVVNYIKQLRGTTELKILDVGCGAGRNMEEFQKIGSVTGLDYSNLAIKYCRRRGLKNLILSSAEKTPLKSASFDVITLLDVLEHTDDILTLKEMHRLLKKKGLLIITVPAFPWLWSEWDNVLQHKRRYTKENLNDILKDNKFIVLKISYLYAFLVIPVFIIRKLKEKFHHGQYPSDFKLSNPLLNLFLNNLAKLEMFLINYFPIPFGTSVIAVVRK